MVSLKTFRAKIKILKLEAKNDLWDIFRLKLGEKTIVTFGISTLEFVNMQKSFTKQTKANLGPKMSYLGILGCKFEKVLSYLKSVSSNL